MKNAYYVEGDYAFIILPNEVHGVFEAKIDIEDLELVKGYPGKWLCNRNVNTGTSYCCGYYKEKTIGLHRWILKPPEGKEVDHINHDTLDNSKGNLRVVTHAENQQNKKGAYKNSKSGVRGVFWNRSNRKWETQIRVNSKKIYLGKYHDLEKAKKVVEDARKKYMKFAT
ncbi:HNH endonuclease [Halobacillus karajensis]|uniref:NHN endonuclease n=1 Tax=Halobacillus karajensis TaxID=195088 RepID=A0A059NXS1_9BACI|nr:HNH endonuclease [Halobacillus karajensis]CDQ22586.1 putative NHN endonuclease [Halobacillus karajensis]CDQ26068.1 putative NHN endonuclease [Halobacillus karajensis]